MNLKYNYITKQDHKYENENENECNCVCRHYGRFLYRTFHKSLQIYIEKKFNIKLSENNVNSIINYINNLPIIIYKTYEFELLLKLYNIINLFYLYKGENNLTDLILSYLSYKDCYLLIGIIYKCQCCNRHQMNRFLL